MIIEYSLAPNEISNEDLLREFPDFDVKTLEEKVGIKKRYKVNENQTALDLAIDVCNKLFEKNNVDKDIIDYVILCTQSPDYFLPTTACLLQDELKLRKNIGAIDFNLGCSGYIYGLNLAKGILLTNVAENVLFVTSETYSKYIHKDDKVNRYIFSDAATATLVNKNDIDKIFNFVLGTDGAGRNNLIVRNGASRYPFDINPELLEYGNKNFYTHNNLYMHGPEIFNFTIENVPPLVKDTLSKNNLSIDEIDYFVFHQANQFMLDYLRKKLKIPTEKFYNNISDFGNTVSSTIPIAIKDLLEREIIKSNDKILLAGFGVGYSWGATIIEI